MWKVSAPLLRCVMWGTWPRRVEEAAGVPTLASAAAQGRVGDGTRGRSQKEGLTLNLQLCSQWRFLGLCVSADALWHPSSGISPFLQEVFVECFL